MESELSCRANSLHIDNRQFVQRQGHHIMSKGPSGEQKILGNRSFLQKIIICIVLLITCLEMASGFPTDNQEEFGTEPTNEDLASGIEYLTKFGYIEDKPGAYRSADELRGAITRLQAMAQVPQTGEFDAATREKMNSPRCGVRDGPNPNDPLSYELGPSKWDKNILTYKIVTHKLTSDLPENVVRDDLKGAMSLWERVTPLRFKDADTSEGYKYLSRDGVPDIEVTFETGDHRDGSPFDGPGKVLAHAFSPGKGRGGDVHFDDAETWSSQSERGVNFLIVAAHELGHSLGLDHSKEKGSLMYPWYAGYQPNYQLHTDDVAGIQHLYGSSNSQPTPPTPRMQTMSPTATTIAMSGSNPRRMDTCGRLDAVASIRGEIFAFYSKYFWRMTNNGVLTSGPFELSQFWFGLPASVTQIDAAFERPENGIIVFFSGRYYYEFDGNTIRPESRYGTPISNLGLPSYVTSIDAVLNYNRRVYLFSGQKYWRLAMADKTMRVESAYPYSTDQVKRGIVFPIDAAFSEYDSRDGTERTYFIKGTSYWLYNDSPHGYPRNISELWKHCGNNYRSPDHFSAAPRHHASSITSLCVIALLQISLLADLLLSKLLGH